MEDYGINAWDYQLGLDVAYGSTTYNNAGSEIIDPSWMLQETWTMDRAAIKLIWLLTVRGKAASYWAGLGLGGSLLAEKLACADMGYALYVNNVSRPLRRGGSAYVTPEFPHSEHEMYVYGARVPTGETVVPVVIGAWKGQLIAGGIRALREKTFTVTDVACVIDCNRGAAYVLSDIGVRLHSLFTPDQLLKWTDDREVRESWAAQMEEGIK